MLRDSSENEKSCPLGAALLGRVRASDCTRMCVVKNRNLGCYRQKPKRATTQIRVQHTEQGHSYEFNVVRQQQGVPEISKECTRSAHTEQNAGWPRMNLYAHRGIVSERASGTGAQGGLGEYSGVCACA